MPGTDIKASRCAAAMLFVAIALAFSSAAQAQDETLQRLVEITDFTGISTSPDGRYVAYRAERASLERNDYSSEWFVYRLGDDAPPRHVADGGAPIFTSGWPLGEWPRWSSDSRQLYFRALKDGEVQIWRASIDGAAEQITNDPSDVRAFELLSETILAYEVGPTRAEIECAELDEYYAGVRIDETVPIGQGLYRSGLVNGRLATQRYLGQWMNVTTLLGNRPTKIKVLELDSGRTRNATVEEAAAFRRLSGGPAPGDDDDKTPGRSPRMHVTQDGRLAHAHKVGDERELRARLDDEATDDIVCAAPECARPIGWLSWRGQRNDVIFATKDYVRGNAQTIYAWDVDRNETREILKAPGLMHSGRVIGKGEGCAVSERYAVCIAADANTPPRIEEIDLDTGGTRVIAEPNAALSRAPEPRAELLRWKNDQGRTFSGYFIPAAGASTDDPSPLFITHYTCQGYLRGGFGDEWPLVSLARAGVAALCINMAPADNEGRLVTHEYDIALSGVEAAVDMLASRGVDRERVGMGGFSFGASVVMWTAYHTDLLAAASLATPEISETYYWQRALMGETFKKTLSQVWELGAPDETPDRWRKFSPSENLDKLRFPLLMQVPEQEYLVAPVYFVPLITSGAPTEVYVFPHEPHYKFQPRHRLAVYTRNLDWFRFWLLGEDAGPGVREEQFERWRELRERARSNKRNTSLPEGDHPARD